jgi:hypothetical protein
MSGITRVNCNPTNCLTLENEGSEEKLQQELKALAVEKQTLLAEQERIQRLLKAVEEKECAIKAQMIQSAQKVAGFVGPALIVNTAHIVKSRDGEGERDHYQVSLRTQDNDTLEIAKWPIDTKKYGEIKQIVILSGENKTIFKCDDVPMVARLVKYLSTDFDVLRKEMNGKTVDGNGYYSNKHQVFDCQRFAYYLRRGVEGTFNCPYGLVPKTNYREAKHSPFGTYAMKGQTSNFGRDGKYGGDDLSKHYYVCLTDQVFVSKYGTTDVLFTSHQHILDAYFPAKFVVGNHWSEW